MEHIIWSVSGRTHPPEGAYTLSPYGKLVLKLGQGLDKRKRSTMKTAHGWHLGDNEREKPRRWSGHSGEKP